MSSANKPTDVKKKRFAVFSDEEMSAKVAKTINKNTKRNEDRTERIFKDFLREMNDGTLESCDFYNFDEETLDKWLIKFWWSARKRTIIEEQEAEGNDGKEAVELYRVSTFENMRYSLNRALKKAGKKFDIIKSIQFIKSQEAFNQARVELKQKGMGYVDETPVINPVRKYHLFFEKFLLRSEKK
jgi:hypothetical protein